MISIALNDKTVEVVSINTAYDAVNATHQLWATKKSDGKSFVAYSNKDKAEVDLRKSMIDKAIELGDYLVELKEGE